MAASQPLWPSPCLSSAIATVAWRRSEGGGADPVPRKAACVGGERAEAALGSPEQEVWVGRALVWEAGVLAAAASWGYVCRLPGSGVPRGTSDSDPHPPTPKAGGSQGGSPGQEALSELEVDEAGQWTEGMTLSPSHINLDPSPLLGTRSGHL